MELVRRRETTPISARTTFSRARTTTIPHARRENPPPSVKSVYEEHARFVWLTLQRLGVDAADLADLAHDVFVVVHRRIHTFDSSSRMTTWLFGICMRLAANYRRRQRRVLSEA